MAAYKLYVRGASAAVLVEDLGFTVPQGPSWTLLNSSTPSEGLGDSGQFTARDIRDSADLVTLIHAGTLEWSKDGSNAETGTDYVADFMLMQDFTDDFLDLTSGILTVPNGVSAPGAGQEGNIFWDSDNEALYMHDGSDWLLVATASGVLNDHGALEGLDDDDHTQYALLAGSLLRNVFTGGVDFSSTSGLILPVDTDRVSLATVEGNVMFDSDNNQLWVYDGDNWLSIPMMLSGVMTHGSLAGLDADDHPQYHDGTLSYTGDLNMGTNDITNVGLVDGVDVSALSTTVTNHIADSSIHFTQAQIDHGVIQGLDDDDHPQYTAWAQDETVTGVWTFDPADTEPNFIMEPVAAAPTNNLVAGAMAVINGILCAYDTTRSKWLSIDRKILTGSKDGSAKNVYLRHDNIAMSQTGLRALRDGTITGIFLQSDVASTWTLEVRRNGTVSVLASLASGGLQGAQSAVINADFSAGDELQLFANTSGATIVAPIAGIEIAWRF